MELKKFQDQFESREAIDQFYSCKKLFKVFEKTNIWLEIFENNKVFMFVLINWKWKKYGLEYVNCVH